VLKRRAAKLPVPIQMSDALSRNAPKSIKLLVAHCLAHGRRQFVQITPNFPQQCRHVLEALGDVYHQDRLARERGLSRVERLHFHQQHSQPVMKDLHQWLEAQLKENKVEPNSGLGKAIGYMLRHWQALTFFLREPGAPLGNNLVERALKKAILHRKNSLFYKTLNGADVGDLYMSLIHTYELNDVNPFDYLTELQRHTEELAAKPADWMPWNYRVALERSPLKSSLIAYPCAALPKGHLTARAWLFQRIDGWLNFQDWISYVLVARGAEAPLLRLFSTAVVA
jgi:hypothetical protein